MAAPSYAKAMTPDDNVIDFETRRARKLAAKSEGRAGASSLTGPLTLPRMFRHGVSLAALALIAALAGGCVPNDEGVFTVGLKNDGTVPVRFGVCRPSKDCDEPRNPKPLPVVEPGNTFLGITVSSGETGRIGVFSAGDEPTLIGCIPFAFEEEFIDGSVRLGVSQAGSCDSRKPASPLRSGKPV